MCNASSHASYSHVATHVLHESTSSPLRTSAATVHDSQALSQGKVKNKSESCHPLTCRGHHISRQCRLAKRTSAAVVYATPATYSKLTDLLNLWSMLFTVIFLAFHIHRVA